MPGRAEGGAAVAVVIPAYEAADTIPGVVDGVLRALPGAKVYVVDDGSRDKTGDKAGEEGRGKGVTVLTHPRNLGKGAALRTGIARALADGARIVVTLDADGQHAPAQLPRLLAPLARDEADLVLGARARTAAMPWRRRCTNWRGQPIADAQTGFRAFSRAVAHAARPAGSRYDFETAFLLQALARGFRVRSVPVATIYDGGRSHFRSWADSWRLALVFARYGRRILLGAP